MHARRHDCLQPRSGVRLPLDAVQGPLGAELSHLLLSAALRYPPPPAYGMAPFQAPQPTAVAAPNPPAGSNAPKAPPSGLQNIGYNYAAGYDPNYGYNYGYIYGVPYSAAPDYWYGR